MVLLSGWKNIIHGEWFYTCRIMFPTSLQWLLVFMHIYVCVYVWRVWREDWFVCLFCIFCLWVGWGFFGGGSGIGFKIASSWIVVKIFVAKLFSTRITELLWHKHYFIRTKTYIPCVLSLSMKEIQLGSFFSKN